MEGDDAVSVGLGFGPMTERRAADGFDIERGGQNEAEAEDARAGDVHGGVGSEHGAIFAKGKRVLGFDAHVGFDRRRLQ